MTKDYKKLYDELKRDFDAAIEFTVRLENDLIALRRDAGLRERIAQCVFSTSYGWQEEYALAIYNWITGAPASKPVAPKHAKKTKVASSVSHGMAAPSSRPKTKKRKYTKKSKFWKKSAKKK